MATIDSQGNPITQARILLDAQRELQEDLLEQGHDIVKTLLGIDTKDHHKLGSYRAFLVPLLHSYKDHTRAFDLLEQEAGIDSTVTNYALKTITHALDAIALDVVTIITQPRNHQPQEASIDKADK